MPLFYSDIMLFCVEYAFTLIFQTIMDFVKNNQKIFNKNEDIPLNEALNRGPLL